MSRNKPTLSLWPLRPVFWGTATRGAPTYRQGEQEIARRRRQIELGQLTASNGLVKS